MGENTNTCDSTTISIDLKDLKAPLHQMASDMDRSINWIVRKMLKEHPSLANAIKEKEKVNAVKA